MGACMVKVSRYHAELPAILPARALSQGTSAAWLHPGLAWVCAELRASSFPAGHTAWLCSLCAASSCPRWNPEVQTPPLPQKPCSSSAPALLKAHFCAHSSMSPRGCPCVLATEKGWLRASSRMLVNGDSRIRASGGVSEKPRAMC